MSKVATVWSLLLVQGVTLDPLDPSSSVIFKLAAVASYILHNYKGADWTL